MNSSLPTPATPSRSRSRLAGALGAALVVATATLMAGLPQPMCVYYGQAVDGYGIPYSTNAAVILRKGTNEIARHTIRGSLSPGVNFALYAHLDDGRTVKSYSRRSVRSGDVVTVTVKDDLGEKLIMERPVPPVSQPGGQILINVTAAEDSDGDGLPDAWEWQLIFWSDGWLLDLTDVRPGDDFDGDGLTNLQEYRAGTFPFLDYDYFYAEKTELTPRGNVKVSFYSVPGKTYSAECVTNFTTFGWTSCPLALSDDGPLQTLPAEGNGQWLSLYFPPSPAARLFRLVVR